MVGIFVLAALAILLFIFLSTRKGKSMPRGLEIYDADGSAVMSTSDRLVKVHAVDVIPPNTTRHYQVGLREGEVPYVVATGLNSTPSYRPNVTSDLLTFQVGGNGAIIVTNSLGISVYTVVGAY